MAYEIHENVPVNAVVGMEGEYPLSAMNVGDMFEINLAQEFHLDEFQDSDLAQMERLAINLRARIRRIENSLGFKFRFRRLDRRDKTLSLSPTLGVWRIK